MNSCPPPTNSKRLSDISILSAAPEMQKCIEREKYRQKHDSIQDRFGDRWNSKLERDTSDGLVACNFPITKCCAISDSASSALSDDVPFVFKNTKISFKGAEERSLAFLQNLSLNRSHESSDEECALSKTGNIVKNAPLTNGTKTEEHLLRSIKAPSNIQNRGRNADKISIAGNINYSALKKSSKANYKSKSLPLDDDLLVSDEDGFSEHLVVVKKDDNWGSTSDLNDEAQYFPLREKSNKLKDNAINTDLEPDCISLRHQIENIIAESKLENQQEWKNKTLEDVEIARKNIKQISDVYSELIGQMRNEKKVNNTLQLKKDLKRQEEIIQQCRNENGELTKRLQKEKQFKQKAIDESNDKITTLKEKMDEGKCRMKIRYEDLKAKIDELQDQVKSEKAQHDITKNAYNLLHADWNKLYEKLTEIRTAIMSIPSNQSSWIDDTKLSISD
ncbi:Hypothetical predicted protein [Octopus vulgaris]|uniref:Uncharacterized protein n=1 Tax=Octopus vulgaris TaxID=6645 RepID=A0AA36BC62_OCTVU|nr:Hypothetical predicted protein [Octopus vulgaris]